MPDRSESLWMGRALARATELDIPGAFFVGYCAGIVRGGTLGALVEELRATGEEIPEGAAVALVSDYLNDLLGAEAGEIIPPASVAVARAVVNDFLTDPGA